MLEGQNELYKHILTFNKAIYVEAPAGCGKTYACVRSANLIAETKLIKDFQKILILTFSKNARAQILNELTKYDKSSNIFKHIEIANYHSFYKKYLDKYRDVIGFKKEFTIVDDEEYKGIFKVENITFGEFYKIDGKYYSSSSNLEITNERIINSYEKVYELSKETGIITFNMFGVLINQLFDKSEQLAELICHDYPYIFLDEYQDTDELQERFISKLFQYSKFVFFADPIQMIYGFKGASDKRLSKLRDFFPNIIEIQFTENFRYKCQQDIIDILNDIRLGRNINYSNLVSGGIFQIPVRLHNKNELFSKYGKNILPSCIVFSILKKKYVELALKNNKSICILVNTNELVNKICQKFEEKRITCHEISDSQYMLKLNIIVKKYFNSSSIDEMILFALQIYALCKYNKKIDEISYKNLNKINLNNFRRKKTDEFVNLKNFVNNYDLTNLTIENKKDLLSNFVKLIKRENKNFAACHFIETISKLKEISDKNIDNIYTQKQYESSYSKIKSGLYIANYYQCKGREFDEVIIIVDPGIEDIKKNRNILYVIHSRMKEKLYIGKYDFVG